jgi:hypothetical protein
MTKFVVALIGANGRGFTCQEHCETPEQAFARASARYPGATPDIIEWVSNGIYSGAEFTATGLIIEQWSDQKTKDETCTSDSTSTQTMQLSRARN